MRLTTIDVLRAVKSAVSPKSAYINDEVNKLHSARAATDPAYKGHPPRSSLVLRRLRELERGGLLSCSRFPSGLYGYTWAITDAGRRALEAP